MSLSAIFVALALVSSGVFIALAFTPWGRRRPLHRYGALSVAAHLLLFAGLACVRTGGPPRAGDDDAPPVSVRIVMRSPAAAESAPDVSPPAESQPAPEEPPPPDPKLPEATSEPVVAASRPHGADSSIEPMAEQAAARQQAAEPPTAAPEAPKAADAAAAVAEAFQLPEASPTADLGDESIADSLRGLMPSAQEAAIAPWPVSPTPIPRRPSPIPRPASHTAHPSPLPAAYATRGERQQRRLSANDGGDDATLDAVASAVDWLVRAQRPDGAWDAARWGAGRETLVLGENRGGAGGRAETGLTGLALLAIGGAGHTHLAGPHRDAVTRGLQFLLDTQAPDGDLAGDAKPFARTYCHSMATFALAEAMAVTGDERLRAAVEAAVEHLTRAQHPTTGGWRYRPGDRGDTSQMGWAVMALRSAELAGVVVRPSVWSGCERFVASVRAGRHGGLACYQPRERPSSTMTAEAMYVRQILGMADSRGPADAEAAQALLGELPDRSTGSGRRVANLYYWYYATLALHHHSTAGGAAADAWSTWNQAMQRAVLSRQVASGANAGSWDPDTLWGAYGGRVYSTALATMCLEVYYRYDPDTIGRDPWLAARESAIRR
ncbi:prenyltransferase/squalene oxidase repeat-containing protein [Botrimarina sp.]|uniref:prenyltransferase/squalene oxidase repeat-containing protein n=1 Tax=Botrimarina sp. TaxID=2795802 RepID=UPI0032EE1099